MRRSGQTTRLVDEYIQHLFDAPGVALPIMDHHEDGSHYSANKHLIDILRRRIESEHGREVSLRVVWQGKVPLVMLKGSKEPSKPQQGGLF